GVHVDLPGDALRQKPGETSDARVRVATRVAQLPHVRQWSVPVPGRFVTERARHGVRVAPFEQRIDERVHSRGAAHDCLEYRDECRAVGEVQVELDGWIVQ